MCLPSLVRYCLRNPDTPLAVAWRVLNRILAPGKHSAFRDNYSFENGEIVWKWRTRRKGAVEVARITRRWVEYEMVFDIVYIELASGEGVRWLDYHNDLVGLLTRHAQDKQIDGRPND